MALVFNPVMTGNNGIMAALYCAGAPNLTSTSSIFYSANIYFYPDSVPFPSTSPNTVTAGHVANANLSTRLAVSNTGAINLSSSTNLTVSNVGNVSWWLIHSGTAANKTVCSNSLGTSNVGNIVQLNTLTISNVSDTVTLSGFNLKLL